MRAANGKTWLRSSAIPAIVAATLAAMSAAGVPAHAQQSGSVTDYRLPDPNRTQAPRVQGPVDPDNPLGTPAQTPQPDRTPSPTPTPAPRITIPAPRPTPPAQDRVPETRRARPSATETDRPVTQTEPALKASTTPEPEPPTPEPTTTTSPAANAASPEIEASPAQANISPAPQAAPRASTNWLIPGVLGLFVLGGAVFLFQHRRRSATDSESEIATDHGAPDVSPPPSPPPPPELQPVAPKAITPAVPAHEAPGLAAEPFRLAIAFVPTAVRLSLVYATVQYELELANAGTHPSSPLQVRADLASAHASLRTQDQLAPAPERLDIKHTLAPLAPGESQTLKGEVRVPLHEISTVVKGTARFLVPLVRFCILAPDGEGIRRVFTVGPRDPESGAITSVRLDAGPRNLRELDAREIEAARGFALDQAVVHS